MSKHKHLKCPGCGAYIRGHVKETRNEYDGILRRRVCEECGVIIETLEKVSRFYSLGAKKATVRRVG